ncbi:hypothetical protein MYP_644 [Sporocytophaga myxococcoides]|uniref:Peptidoglycan binding-like domain-containing protein n=1 Tax=Sporocytophaga myxococcoides TaxID=153721 RepID=A0A098LAG0_9BACT|nr:hypothetical protein [Sporocytophaga myxococcoides]GAL83417.1 hypothetical protein MYP_644 [Sporocytophaga myxococcoides]
MSKRSLIIFICLFLLIFLFVKSKERAKVKVQNVNDDSFPLKIGKRGKRVEQVQIWLKKMDSSLFPAGINGVFDQETENALLLHKKRTNISETFWNKISIGHFQTTIFK